MIIKKAWSQSYRWENFRHGPLRLERDQHIYEVCIQLKFLLKLYEDTYNIQYLGLNIIQRD